MTKRETRYITRRVKNIDKRNNITLAIGPEILFEMKNQIETGNEKMDKHGNTWAISVLPSYKSIHVEGILQISSVNLYETKAVLKGMNTRPRMKITLGNTLMRKERKRSTKQLVVKDRESRGRQIQIQYVRVIWDIRNRELINTYKKYRESGKDGTRPGRYGQQDKKSIKGLRKAMKIYEVIRGCEVYRNGYELRTLMKSIDVGKRLRSWQREDKYRRLSGNKVNKLLRNEEGRMIRKHTDESTRNLIYKDRRSMFKKKFIIKYKKIRKRLDKETDRIKAGEVKALQRICEKTREKPIQQVEVKHPNRIFIDKKLERMLKIYPIISEDIEIYREDDKRVKLQMEVPTTQYFAKRKNVRRIADRRSDDPVENSRKIRKRPEGDRIEIYPHWGELDGWGIMLMEKIENNNLQKVLKGEEVDMKYAKYRELGRRVWFMYRIERGEIYKK